MTTSVSVNHNYPHDGDMRTTDSEGNPIDGVQIRVFEHDAFESGIVDTWVAETETDANGEWVDPIVLDSGATWVVHFEKPTMYGPTHMEITT